MSTLKYTEVREKNDIDTVVLLADSIWREHYAAILSQGQIEYMLERFQSYQPIKRAIDDGERYYILAYDGLPVGYFAIKKNGKKMYLDKIYLIKEKRGEKLGAGAVEFVKKLARDSGCNAVYLTVNKYNVNSIKAYRSFGFTTESAVNTDIGNGYVMDDYQMYLFL